MKKRKVLAFLLALSMAVSTNGMVVYATEPVDSVITQESGAEQTETGDPSDLGDKDEDNSGDSDQSKDENDGDDADKKDQDGEVKDDQGEQGEQTEMTETPVDPDVEDATEEKDIEDVEKNELTGEKSDEVRMETFTDETGMTITYDAVMATSFDAEVRGGILYSVETDANDVLDLREKTEIEIIDSNIFQGKDKTAIKYIMLPKSVKTIGASAFEGCSSLKGISIPSRLTTIGNNAFKDCTSLTQLALPNSVTSIGDSAFEGDNKLFMVHMVSAEYSKLATIGQNAFNGCSALEFFCSDDSYHLPDSITSIGATAFAGCKKLTKINMGDTITTIGEGVFQNCTSISEIKLSGGLSTIPTNAFSGCIRLVRITFGYKAIRTEIATDAFADCSRLSSVELPEQINKVCTNAFERCNSLRRVYVDSCFTILEDNAFPDLKEELCLVAPAAPAGSPGTKSTAKQYAEKFYLRFVAANEPERVEYYQYKYEFAGTQTDYITLKVTTEKSPTSKTPDINDITNKDGDKGVKAGTICYLQIDYGEAEGVKPVAGSIKCNGIPLTASNGVYSFAMPIGGATITAEFELKAGGVLIEGNENSVEGRLSSDATFVVNKDKSGSATLKVGQSTKFYLTDSGSRIPTSKVTYSLSKTTVKGIVSVDKDGTVKALKPGTAVVCADVKNRSMTITRMVTIKVEQTKIDHISMLVPSYENDMTLIKEAVTENGQSIDKIIGISVPSGNVTKNYTFNLKAVAFSSEEDDEAMAVAFTWATSDAKIAKLAKTSTTATSSVNTVTIPIKTDGEATITVTATNADKTKETQTFVVRVENYTPRLTSSKITVNPNQKEGTKLEIISAYGKPIESLEVVGNQVDFPVELDSENSNDSVSTYKVSVRDGLPDKTYTVKLQVKVKNAWPSTYQLPLSIVVKRSVPNPKVAFAKNQQKINLFYKNDGTQIKPVISNLGDAKVSEYSLEALTAEGNKNYENDKKFKENFEVENVDGNPVIIQKSAKLACNTSNKPVVTGYLVMKFDGYKDDVVKKYKITIPTQTVAPSYVLSTTSNTFGTSYKTDQEIYLQLLDNKNKKAPIKLDPAKDTLLRWNNSTTGSATCSIVGSEDPDHEGMIKVIVSRNPDKGRLVMRLTNSDWADGKQFLYTYQVNTDTRAPKISLKPATVTLNTSYPEQTATFAFVSNQFDTKIDTKQTFEEPKNLKAALQEQYDKLEVVYEDGVGKVSIQNPTIKAGTYKFTCDVKQEGAKFATNRVTLNVKVTKTIPTVTLKGTNSFNLMAYTEDDKGEIEYVEKSEMTLTTRNLPGDYKLVPETTLGTIECTTRGYKGVEECFDFQWKDDKLIISMKEEVPARTYAFRILPTFKYKYGDDEKDENSISPAKYSTFSIKVYNGKISVRLGARGRMNLVKRATRYEECTEQNGVRYTPTFTNLKDTLADVVILDASGEYPTYDGDKDNNRFISQQFEAKIAADGKSFFVVPKAGVDLENKKSYQVRIWMKTNGYVFPSNNGGIYAPSIVKLTTAEVLPKVKTSQSTVNLYLSSRDYETSFVVSKADLKAVGDIKKIAFGDKDEKANRSFNIFYEPQKDGSLKVKLKLKNTVSYACNTTNKITMYVKYQDQGTNTAGTAVTMNVRINK